MKSRELKTLSAGQRLVRKATNLGRSDVVIGRDDEKCGSDEGEEGEKEICLNRRKIINHFSLFK